MLTRDEVRKTLRDHRTEWAEFDVEAISVFGSVARGQATTESDLDVLVDFRSAPTFDSYMGLKIYLEDLFGRPVDLATRKALKPRVRDVVEREAVRVA